MKYIVYHTCNVEDVIIWSNHEMSHIEMATKLGVSERIIAGGYIEPKDRFCCGEAVSLGVRSRGFVDEDLIQNKYYKEM